MSKIENKQIEEEYGWNAELLYQLIDSVQDYSIIITDLEGVVRTWNPGAEKVFGFKADEIIGQNGDRLFTPEEDQKKGVPEEEMRTARDEGCALDERWHVRKDGSHFFASGIMTPLYKDGRHIGYAKIARDLTERVKLEDELRQERENLQIKVEKRTDELKQEVTQRRRSQEQIVRLLRQIVSTQEVERKRIARDIHDHLGQQLTVLKLQLEALKEQCGDNSELCNRIEKIQEMTRRLDSEVDFLAWELRPSVLDDLGLIAALKNFVKEWSRHYQISAEFHSSGLGEERLYSEIEINLYRIAQEALNNISKHAEASQVNVLVERRDNNIILIIEDDGKGFKPSEKENLTADDRGMGLLGMRERAALIGGTLEIESAPGDGTTVYVRVPIQFNDEAETSTDR